MKIFFDREDFDYESIESLIKNEVEESIHLEFKSARSIDKSEGKKKEISKDISAFANADGGLIIYGLEEIDHKANAISFIDGNIYSKEWLEQVINSLIQRRIQDLKIFVVRKDNLVSQTLYVIKIPLSLDAPHQSKDKRFYKRFNFESVAMEEYEVRQLYNRRSKSKLEIDEWAIRLVNRNEDGNMLFSFEVMIFNSGDISESSYKVNVIFENFDKRLSISWDREKQNYDYTFLENDRVKISAGSSMPIYPSETLNVMRFKFLIPIEHLNETLTNMKVRVTLFYTNGEDRSEGYLNDLLTKILNKEIDSQP